MSTFFSKTLSFLGLAEEAQIEDEQQFNEEDRETAFDTGINNDNAWRPESKRRPGSAPSNISRSGKLLSIDGGKDNKKIRVTVLQPNSFEDVQMVADDLKSGTPVIVNLQTSNNDLAKRIIDFCSGVSYAIEGSIKKVADKVFLITPENTIVSSSEKEILGERGFYNQL